MLESTITDKGQTTVPRQVRDALGLEPRKRLQWDILADGTATVRPEPSPLDLFASLKSDVPFSGLEEERAAVRAAVADQAAKEGTEPS